MNKKKPVSSILRGPLMYLVLLLIILWIVQMLGATPANDALKLNYSTLLKWVEADVKADNGLPLTPEEQGMSISNVIITENTLIARKEDSLIPAKDFGARYDITAIVPSETQFYSDVSLIYDKLLGVSASPADYSFDIETKLPAGTPWWYDWLPLFISLLLFGGLWFFIMRQQTGGNKGVMSFGKSRARLTDPNANKVTFKDVAGADEEKDELKEIVTFLKDPKRFTDVGARIPTGVLLIGPPGTGKTLLARAVSGEAGVPFFTISGSDFVEMFVGVGASRVRDLFNEAKKSAPSIVFIDEIDAVGRQRGAGLGGGHDEREQTLNQLLVEMDGFTTNQGVIVMAATNRADILDPALLRPGRFDRRIMVNYPDVKGREEILKVHSRNKPLSKDVDLKLLAKRTPYFTGADLENVMNEAAILTAREGRKLINMAAIEEAITRVLSGPEKRSRQITDKDKRLVAYHEGGHAIVSYFIPECDKVHEITTIPRGQAGGYTMFLPKEETDYRTATYLKAEMAAYMGGRVAEALVLNEISTGASEDIKRATEIARSMVTKYGMSDKLGPIFLGGDQEVFLGRSFSQQSSNFSDEVTALIDHEVQTLLKEGYTRAEDILNANMDKLHALADLLIEREKLDYEEFDCFMRGEPLPERKPEPMAEPEPIPDPETELEEREDNDVPNIDDDTPDIDSDTPDIDNDANA